MKVRKRPLNWGHFGDFGPQMAQGGEWLKVVSGPLESKIEKMNESEADHRMVKTLSAGESQMVKAERG